MSYGAVMGGALGAIKVAPQHFFPFSFGDARSIIGMGMGRGIGLRSSEMLRTVDCSNSMQAP